MSIDILNKLNKVVAVQQSVKLSNYTTFQIGGMADYFCLVDNTDQLRDVLQICKQENVDYYLLGGGSNLLISDQGIKSLVIKLNIKQLQFNGNEIVASGDIALGYLVQQATKNNLTGLEFAIGIPGTVGGAVVGNAGAYGKSIADLVLTVEALDENLNSVNLTKEQMKFSYRDSLFKHEQFILTRVSLRLAKGDMIESTRLIKEYRKNRVERQPNLPSAGCAFKNIILTKEIEEILNKKNIAVPDKFKEWQKVPAGWLIEQLDLKGKQMGGAQVSTEHANYIVNTGNAKAADVIMLISYIKQQIRDNYGIQLEEEIRYVGF